MPYRNSGVAANFAGVVVRSFSIRYVVTGWIVVGSESVISDRPLNWYGRNFRRQKEMVMNMENDFRKEAGKQYLHYFRFWFVGIGILIILCVVMALVKQSGNDRPRTNGDAPTERVYDYADVLTDGEEDELRSYIAKMEKEYQIDIVLVTIEQSVEGAEAMEQYGLRSKNWEQNMQDLADDFWDENRFGYNKGFEGDGVLLLHNWYSGQNGEHLSTSGSVEAAFSNRDIARVLDVVDAYYDTNPYKAYRAYVKEVCDLMDTSLKLPFSWWTVIILPAVIALIYALSGSMQKKAENTVAVNAYVAGGKPVLNDKTDAFIRKSVVTRRIQNSSSGSGSSGSRGGGGHHRSSSGASHGGGSRRH